MGIWGIDQTGPSPKSFRRDRIGARGGVSHLLASRFDTASRAEAGCQDYVFATEIHEPNAMRILERWDDMYALNRHCVEPYMAAFNAVVGGLAAGPLELKTYDVSGEVAMS